MINPYLICSFLVGLISAIYQLFNFETAYTHLGNSGISFLISVSSFIIGLVSCTYLLSLVERKMNALNFTAAFQLVVGLYALVFLSNPRIIQWIINNTGEFTRYLTLWLYFFIPSFSLGASLPLINKLYLNSVESTKKNERIVYLADTLGLVLGIILTGLLFIPRFGMEVTLFIAIAINLAFAIYLSPIKPIKIITTCLFVIFIATAIGKTLKIKAEHNYGKIQRNLKN